MPPNMFKEETLATKENKKKSKDFLKKFWNFTSDNFRLVITRKTRKRRTLFPVYKKTFKLHVKYTLVCATEVRIIPVKANYILKQDGRNIAIQSRTQKQPDIFEECWPLYNIGNFSHSTKKEIVHEKLRSIIHRSVEVLYYLGNYCLDKFNVNCFY